MRGYKMLFEAGYQWGLPDKEGFLCGVYDPDKWSVGASAGFQFNNFVFLGGGTDFQLYRSGGNTYLTVPVFGELRINVLKRLSNKFWAVSFYSFNRLKNKLKK